MIDLFYLPYGHAFSFRSSSVHASLVVSIIV